jgi:NADH-quinone oxidoreductase subunit L
MIGPLVVLAILSVVGGLVGWPFGEGGSPFQQWMAPIMGGHGEGGEAAHTLSKSGEIGLMVLSVLVAVLGIVISFRVYLQQPALSTLLRERFSVIHRTLLNKYWVDELYDATAVRFVRGLADAFWRFWDVKVVDGIVNGVGYTLEGFSAILRLFQTGFVGTYALFFTLGVAAWLLHMLRH